MTEGLFYVSNVVLLHAVYMCFNHAYAEIVLQTRMCVLDSTLIFR